MPFPKDFTWGVAASAYQIEGGADADGRGPSIWDTFCHTPGKVWHDQHADVACDHYHRAAEDVQLMRQLGAKAYRLSISWTRILPHGKGAINQPGLDFYSRLVDDLLANGVTPFVTLFHWDYPEDLYQRGGWLNRTSAQWFADYVAIVTDHLSDRVQHWMTLNEPQVFLKFGHGDGINAPGLKLPLADQLLATHHTLLAHGKGVQALRAHAKTPAQVGWAPVCVVRYPSTLSEQDQAAARHATCAVTQPDLWNNAWFNDPVLLGHYPEEGLKIFGDACPHVSEGDMQTIKQPLDFLGLNIYEGQPVHAGPSGQAVFTPRPVGHPLTAFRWPVEPESLYWGPRFMHERYKLPIYITENGLSNVDWVSLDGKVHDPQRIDFTHRYLRSLRRACDDGVDVKGYFHWSLMDNFEWAAGYKERFGLIYVDFETGRRIPKDSALWYRDVIRANGDNL